MRTRLSEPLTLAALMNAGAGRGRAIATRRWRLGLDKLDGASSLGASLFALEGRSVVVAVGDMAKAAAALIELDGWARRIVLCPPGWAPTQLAAVAREAEADALIHNEDEEQPIAIPIPAPCALPLQPLKTARAASHETEWILPT